MTTIMQDQIIHESLFLTEKVHFKFWVKFRELFREHPEIKKLKEPLEEIEDYLNTTNNAKEYNDINKLNKICGVILKVFSILEDYDYGVLKLFCWTIIPIPYMAIARFNKMIIDSGRAKILINSLRKSISSLKKIREKMEKDSEKQKIDDYIKKLNTTIERYNSDYYNKNT